MIGVQAEKESANLMRMQRGGQIKCPRVVIQNKHVLVMTFIGSDGRPARKLKETKLSPKKLDECFAQVRAAVKSLYNDCHLVHADLSEYNILYHDKCAWIIDVGQSVEPAHPRANEFLFRDCLNVCRYSKSHIIVIKMAHHLDLRCVLLPAP